MWRGAILGSSVPSKQQLKSNCNLFLKRSLWVAATFQWSSNLIERDPILWPWQLGFEKLNWIVVPKIPSLPIRG